MFPDENSTIFGTQLSPIVNRPTRSYSTPVHPPWTLSYITSMTDSTKSSHPSAPLAVRSSDTRIRHEKTQIPVRRKTLSHTLSRKTSSKSRPNSQQAIVGNKQSTDSKPEAVVKSIELVDQPLDQAGRLNDSPLFTEPAPKVVAPRRLDLAPPVVEKTDFAFDNTMKTPVTAVQTSTPFPLREESHVIRRPVLLDSLVNDDDDDTIQSWGFTHVFPHIHTTNSSRESSAPAAIGPQQQDRVAHDGRGARSMGRRIGSNLHLRSQSVPVVRDPNSETDPPRPTTSAKFATWGLGTKGASEDWNDDFDFDEEDEDQEEIMSPFTFDTNPLCAPMSPFMRKVPQSIMERQESVQGQFGQVQELTSLVNELKRLRAQAGILDLMQGKDEALWTEAEGIINLATLDNYDDELAPPKSPSTPGFDFDAFDEGHSPALGHRKSSGFLKLAEQEKFTVEFPKFDMDFRSSPNAKSTKQDPSTPPRTPTTRARGNSSARVKSVLETIYQQRSDKKEVRLTPHHKLPFDTNQLRDLVARAKVVTKSLRDIVCKAEVLCSPLSDHSLRAQSDPPFSQIFSNPQETTVSNGRPGLPKSRSVNGYITNNNGSNDNDLAGRMTLMTVI